MTEPYKMEQKSLEQKSTGGVIESPPVSSLEHSKDFDAEPTKGKARLMVFTWYHDEHIVFEPTEMKYLKYGEEVCPSTGRKHLQGYVMWHNPRSESAVCKKYKCWMRIAKAGIKANDKYVSKDGKVSEFGEKPKQGARSDLHVIKDEILEGKTTADEVLINQPMTYHTYGRTIEKLEDLRMRKVFRTEKTEVHWYIGGTGKGKSHRAYADYNPDSVYNWVKDAGWWDAYKQQDTVVIDEFRGGIEYSDLLRLCDKWPYSVRRRNREPMPFTSKKIIITSPMHPREIYHNLAQNDDLEQLMRRINVWTL